MPEPMVTLPRSVALDLMFLVRVHVAELGRQTVRDGRNFAGLDDADAMLAELEEATGYRPALFRVPRHRALVPLRAT
jgi:hypothetical protein